MEGTEEGWGGVVDAGGCSWGDGVGRSEVGEVWDGVGWWGRGCVLGDGAHVGCGCLME